MLRSRGEKEWVILLILPGHIDLELVIAAILKRESSNAVGYAAPFLVLPLGLSDDQSERVFKQLLLDYRHLPVNVNVFEDGNFI